MKQWGSAVSLHYLRRACLMLGLVLGALSIGAPSALAGSHLSGWSSVDGGEIRYEDYTKYDGARTRAISAWNAVGRIHICPDDASHICDLEIDDIDDPNASYLGMAIHMIAADQLLMNKGNLDDTAELPGGDTERTQFIRRVMAHEMGHTLGLGQHESSTWHFTALMYSPTCTSCNNIQTPRSHDKADYHDLW